MLPFLPLLLLDLQRNHDYQKQTTDCCYRDTRDSVVFTVGTGCIVLALLLANNDENDTDEKNHYISQ